MPASRLTPIADTQGQQVTTPAEVGSLQFTVRGLQLAEARQPGKQVGGTAQHFLQIFRGIGGHLAAEAACSQALRCSSPPTFSQINDGRRPVQQGQSAQWVQRHPYGASEIIGGAQRHQHQAGLFIRECEASAISRSVPSPPPATNCRQPAASASSTSRRASPFGFPGQTHGQLPTLFAFLRHGSTYVFVQRLLPVQNQ